MVVGVGVGVGVYVYVYVCLCMCVCLCVVGGCCCGCQVCLWVGVWSRPLQIYRSLSQGIWSNTNMCSHIAGDLGSCIVTLHIYIYGKTIYLFELKIVEVLSMTLRNYNVSIYGLYRRLVCIITSGSASLCAKCHSTI